MHLKLSFLMRKRKMLVPLDNRRVYMDPDIFQVKLS